ncbi:MAG: hypothetical protein JWQ49_3085, partial [Edaphobacter sp.]|nr:hypothetical protein [Edaphobacter sp.]
MGDALPLLRPITVRLLGSCPTNQKFIYLLPFPAEKAEIQSFYPAQVSAKQPG